MIVGLLGSEISVVGGGDRLFNFVGGRKISGYELMWLGFKTAAVLGYGLVTWWTIPCKTGKSEQSEPNVTEDKAQG